MEDMSLSVVCKYLERWYDVEITLQPGLGENTFYLLNLIRLLIENSYLSRLHPQLLVSFLQFDTSPNQRSLDNRIISIRLQIERSPPNSHV